MLQGEHSAILSTFIKLSFVIKNLVLSIFEWPLETGFTVCIEDEDVSVLWPRVWHFMHQQAAKGQTSLRRGAVFLKPLLLVYKSNLVHSFRD